MTVLSHLALRLSNHPENVATEALAYVLANSAAARRALLRLVETQTGRSLSLDRFETQAANDDQSRPDICGFDASGERPLLIEAKFWAGLTEAQPNGYLASMTSPGVLLFIAPTARLPSLWNELRRRVGESGALMTPLSLDAGNTNAFSAGVASHVLAATSWRTALDFLEQEARAAGEIETAADVRQLQALCERMDTDAFLPLASDELTSSLGRRVLQYYAIASELTDHLVSIGTADVTRLQSAHGTGYSGRYMYLRGNAAFLGFSANYWSTEGMSPLWLQIIGESWKRATASVLVKQALFTAGIEFWERDKSVCVPIVLPTGVERDRVIAQARQQLSAIAAALPEVTKPIVPPQDNQADV